MDTTAPSVIQVEYRGRVAILTIANEKKLNALSGGQYYELAQRMREVAAREDVFITLLIGKGRYFSAGADVTMSRASPDAAANKTRDEQRAQLLSTFAANNLNLAQAFYSHPKILVVGLNGPAVGLSAALVALADFVYAAPHAFLLTPFSSIGLVAEGGASRALVQRLGLARANEALLMSRAIPCAELLACGFVNGVFADDDDNGGGGSGGGSGRRGPEGADARFRERVLREIDDRLGPHLVGDSLLGIKALIRRPERDVMDAQNVAEVMAGLERFMTGVPLEEFRKLASGQKRHKL